MYFIANWKMFGGLSTLNSINKVIKFLKTFKKSKKIKIIYCPPNTLINLMSKKFLKTSVKVGAQNCHESMNYAPLTGSVNPSMLKSVGAKYVIIGHSENRQSGETDKLINLKVKAAIKAGLKVIFCIGETLSQKRKKITKKILSKQIKLGLNKVQRTQNIIIAYEPVWSIGTGVVPNNLELEKNIKFIKSIISKKFNNYKILYGGSVSPNNIKKLNMIDLLDGYLIGGASQSSKKLIDIIKKTFN